MRIIDEVEWIEEDEMSDKRNLVQIVFVSVLFIVFLVLKLTGNIDWSWWWVTAPLWISITLTIGIFAGSLLFAIIGSYVDIETKNLYIIVESYVDIKTKKNSYSIPSIPSMPPTPPTPPSQNDFFKTDPKPKKSSPKKKPEKKKDNGKLTFGNDSRKIDLE